MHQPKIHTNELADLRLTPFGVSCEELKQIALQVAAARADSVDDDPVSAEGLFGYIFGTRALRQVFRRAGFFPYRKDNVEGVIHPQSGVRVVFQNVDIACSLMMEPKPLSKKGPGSARIVDAAQGGLFDLAKLDQLTDEQVSSASGGVWYFGVAISNGRLSAELFLPSGIEGTSFGRCIERIFIVDNEDPFDPIADNGDDFDSSGEDDFDVAISRK